MKILVFEIFEKGQILRPQNWIFKDKLRVSYVYIEESFDTIFNMGYGSGKSAVDERVNKLGR